MFTKDIGIDLGTANTLVYLRGKGIIIREPSVVAVNTHTDRAKYVGKEAKEVIGRTPGSIVAVRPLKDGVIADFETTTILLQEFIRKAMHGKMFARARVIICIPSGVTAVERRAVRDAADQAGAKPVLIVEEPMAAAIGAGLPTTEPTGCMVLDIGGGSLEVAMGSDEEPTVALSAPAGAGRVTTEFLPSGMATPDELEDVRKNVRKILEPMVKVFPQSKHPNHAVGTSKTFRSLARLCGAVMRAPGREDSWIMTREQLEDWIPRLAAIAPEQRVALPGITPERTMQIVGGGVVADEIMKALNIQEVEICPWALREGAILRWLDQFGRTRLGF